MDIGRIENRNIVLKKVFLFAFSIELIARLVGIYSLLPSIIDTVLFTITSLFGLLLLFIDFFILKKIKIKQNMLLLLFILALIVSSLVNGPIGLIANIKLIIWQVIYLFVVFQIGRANEMKRSIFTLEKLLIVIWTILASISIIMFVIHFSYVAPLDKFYNGLRVGFVENRLYGVFADPNFAGTISVVILFLSVYRALSREKCDFNKLSNIVFAVVQFIYIILSGSRTAFIALIVTAFFGVLFFLLNKRNKEKTFFSILSSVGISLLVVLFIMGGEWVTKTSFIQLARNIPIEAAIKKDSLNKKNKENVTLTRQDVENKDDVSNNRFELWKSSFEIFKDTPIVGTSPRNMVTYAEKNLPHTFIATKKQTSHNFFFYLLATSGIIGTLPIVLFILIRILKSLRILIVANLENYDRFLLDNLISLTILISACFLTELVLVNKLGTFLFWLYLGKVAGFTDEFSKKRDVGYDTIKS